MQFIVVAIKCGETNNQGEISRVNGKNMLFHNVWIAEITFRKTLAANPAPVYDVVHSSYCSNCIIGC